MRTLLMLALVTLAACGGSDLTAPCPSLQSVIGHEFNTHTCQVLP